MSEGKTNILTACVRNIKENIRTFAAFSSECEHWKPPPAAFPCNHKGNDQLGVCSCFCCPLKDSEQDALCTCQKPEVYDPFCPVCGTNKL